MQQSQSAGRQMLHFLRDTFGGRRSRSRSRKTSASGAQELDDAAEDLVSGAPSASAPQPAHLPTCPLLDQLEQHAEQQHLGMEEARRCGQGPGDVPQGVLDDGFLLSIENDTPQAAQDQPTVQRHSQILELLDFESPIPPQDRANFMCSPETCFFTAPQPHFVDVELDVSNCPVRANPPKPAEQSEGILVDIKGDNEHKAAQIVGSVERNLFRLANDLAGDLPTTNQTTTTTSTFRRSSSSGSEAAGVGLGAGAGLVRSDSWEFAAREGSDLVAGGCQLNQGFVYSDSDSESNMSAQLAECGTARSSGFTPEARNPFLVRDASHRLSMAAPEKSSKVDVPERPKSASSFVYNPYADQWQAGTLKVQKAPKFKRSTSMFSYQQHQEHADDCPLTGHRHQGSAPASPVTVRPSLARCRQRASMFVTSARRSLRGRDRPRSACYSNAAADEDGAVLGMGPLPVDRNSFLRPPPDPGFSTCAYERSSMVEPFRQSSSDAVSPAWMRPHSVAGVPHGVRHRSESWSSCGTDDIDWSWVQQLQEEEEEAAAAAASGQQAPAGESPGPTARRRRCSCASERASPIQPADRPDRPGPDSPRAAAMPKGATPPVGQSDGSTGATNWSYQCDDADADAEDNDESVPSTPTPAGAARPSSSWLRASMRRVRHFRLGDPAPHHPPADRRSAPPDVLPHLPPTTAAVLLSPSRSHSVDSASVSAVIVAGRPTSAPAASAAASGAGAPGRQCGRAALRAALRAARDSAPGAAALGFGGAPGRARSNSTPGSLSASRTSVGGSSQDSSSSSSSSGSESTPTSSPTRSPPAPQPASGQQDNDSDNRSCEDSGMSEASSPLGQWPHNLSSTLACLGCTVGLFNISRFAVLSVQFGANFIIQFLLLSAVFGIPLYTFQVCLGQFLAAGAVDMWRISPVFQGIGIALLVSQALIGVYSIVGVSWIFIYFRDSFITKQDRYRWAEPFDLYREDQRLPYNATPHLEQTVPDYFNGVVLQRHNLATPENSFGHIKFQVAFNLAVVWMIVFVSLSKGLRSYGKVVYVFSVLPVFGMLVLCTKMLGLMPRDSKHQVFPETEWTEFFINSKCWVAATTEVFMTWGLLGTAAMQIASHNKQKQLLQRDSSLVIVFTVSMLLLAAFLANMCVALLLANGFTYAPSSFERMSTYQFLQPADRYQIPLTYATTPVRWMTHTSFVMGERVVRPGASTAQESGYQVLRLATELVPSTLALLGADQVSPFWAVLFYFVLILFGIAQQLAIWHCVITGIMAINAQNLKSWETTITFFSCACGFILGLPMTTELGIFVVYFLDYCVGSGWWLMVLYLLQIGAVLIVRGRPYSGESIAATLFHKSHTCLLTWAAPMLTFTWNVILPVILMVVCITVFKNGGSRDLYSWHTALGYDYWPLWAREVGSMLQLLPIITIPVVGIIQSCRYLSAGPPDLFDRIQLLYRPPLGSHNNLQDLSTQTDPPPSSDGTSTVNASQDNPLVEDPPPKYTPPPSYTTATGARIAKMLRQSFRRSMRRIQHAIGAGESSDDQRQLPASSPGPRSRPPLPPPPDYAAVLVEMNQALQHGAAVSSAINDVVSEQSSVSDITIVITDNNEGRTSLSCDSAIPGSSANASENRIEDFMRPTSSQAGHQRTQSSSSSLTAADVASILRSSVRRPNVTIRSSGVGLNQGSECLPGEADLGGGTFMNASCSARE